MIFTWSFGSLRADGNGVELWLSHGPKPIAVVEPEAQVEPGRDVRAQGLWLSITEESAGHWSVGFEAFGLELDDPDDAFGVPVPIGLDLEWEDDPDATSCRVTGEVLVGDTTISVDGRGSRS